MFFSHKIKCNIETPFKTICSSSSQITCALETKSVMALVRGYFSTFSIEVVDSVLGDILSFHVLYNRLKLLLQLFTK